MISACINSLASYSSEEYCEVLSQQAIPLTLYIFVFCFLAANRAHYASKELKEAHCVAVLSTKSVKESLKGEPPCVLWITLQSLNFLHTANLIYYYMAASVFAMRLVNLRSVTCYTDQTFKAHFGALNLFTSEKKVEIKLQDVYQPWGLRFWLCPSTF